MYNSYYHLDDDTYMVYSDDLDYVEVGCDWLYAYEVACKIRALGYDAEIEYDPIFGSEGTYIMLEDKCPICDKK